ncbi:FkbM family methyltransferase [Halomonas salifodinae]|uniref:protein O-GlcNAc transferase n=1 Tax=Halomonas salifodinae TaxID=438745 RepID=A0ABW2EXU3_9GAMM
MAKPKRRTTAKSNRQSREAQLERLANTFLEHYRAKRLETAVPLAREITERYPKASFGWKALGTALMEAGDSQAAVAPLERALELQPDNNEALTNLGKALQQLGRYEEAEACLNRALADAPENYQANMHLAGIHQQRGRHDQALGYYERSLESLPDALLAQMRKATVLVERRDYDQALAILEPLAEQSPKAVGVLTNLANLYGTMGRFDEAEALYRRAIDLRPDAWIAFSNYYFTAHYNPRHTAEDLFAIGEQWQRRYAPVEPPSRPTTEKAPARPLRIGLISAGLKTHPVGQMILGALEQLPPGQFQLYAYSDSLVDDATARRLKPLMHRWHEVPHTSHGDLARLVRDDAIDILIDMTGHTSGSRLPVIAEEPAPLIVKWVGGLFNTTGVEAVDYLISDAVETPDGVDDGYLEKLIRLPDDYICYTPPRHLDDEPGPLPALSNGHLTLGCFNNPAKINEVLLEQWASLMQALPGSRLLLKGGQYSDANYCERLHAFMEGQGIDRERVLLEGPAPHKELVATYRRVDIALDPWPYSGGLTTCEALYMGVPVVTLPGPSFAGRHSATHLVNAGMPELVVGSWEEYRERVLGLAADLESLATIRRHLRRVLLDSPVCDGPRFARHLTTALRAIWQRYCEDKLPAALSVDKEGQARFADQSEPVQVAYARRVEQANEGFNWQLPGKIIAIDNSAKLIREPGFDALRRLNAFGVVAFDPASRVENPGRFQGGKDVQVFPHAVLGNGQPATLHACLDPALSGTLEPLPLEQQHGANQQGARVLTELPINTIALDNIEGLDSLDWLILDDLSDAMTILEHGEKALKEALLIQVRVAFQPTHRRQPNLAELQHWMARHGFRFYRFNDGQHRSHLPESVPAEQRQATELVSTDAVFLPSNKRTALLSDAQRTKLAFLLHTVFGAKDMAYYLLKDVSGDKAGHYLKENWLARPVNNNMRKGGRAIDNIQEVANYLREASISSFHPNHSLPGSLVVSLTSYSSRFDNLYLTLRSLMLQEVFPDHLILWIAEEEKSELPKNVWELEQYGLNIRFCENMRSYKKIVPSLREYPDSFIVTADDDLYYDSKWLKGLVDSWDGDERTVIAHRAHKIVLNDKGRPLPYRKWKWEVGQKEPVDGLIFPTSGAGVLWPPHVFHSDVTYVRRFMELCPSADDIWLYWMASLNGAKVKCSTYEFRFAEWPSNGVSPLWKENVIGGGNDRQIEKLMSFYDNPFFVSRGVEASKGVSFFYAGEKVKFVLPNERDHIQKIIKRSSSFYELKMLEDIRSRVSGGGVILDVGANIGNHSVYFGMFCETSKVFSFEPHPSIYKVLERNVSENGLSDKVVCCNFGVGEKDGKATVSFYDENNVGMSRLEISGGGDIKVVSLDGFCEELGVGVDLIKIDVEGMEPDVIKGASRVIDRFSPILYVEAGDSTAFEKVNFLLEGYGYESVAKFNATATYLFLRGGVHF